MSSRVFYVIFLSLLLMGMLTLAFNIQAVEASGTIYIRADGSIDPPTAPVSTSDNVTYTLTGDITSDANGIVVERDNIVVDGTGCTVTSAHVLSWNGIMLTGRTNVTVSNMTIESFGQGIALDHSSNNILSGNNLTNDGCGIIVLFYSNNNILSGNTVTGSHDSIKVYSSNNVLSGNTIANGMSGIGFTGGSSDNIMFDNTIIGTGIGIIVLGPFGNNRVYHNNFVANRMQFECYDSVNVWDDGYPSGGNYCSDYTGPDTKSGPNQDQPNSDGIGDTPYIIDANNIDHCPLMGPWTPTETSVRVGGKDYPVIIVSNTTLEQIVATTNTLHFKSSGPSGETGYCNVVFPIVNTTDIKVFIDGKKLTPPPFPVINSNGTHYFIYFEFTLSSHYITIQYAASASEVPVGGEWSPIDKLQSLAPWLCIAFTTAIAGCFISIKRFKKKQS